MGPLSFIRFLLAFVYFSSAAMAQDLQATNNNPGNGPDFDLDLTTPMSEKSYKVDPLTDHSSVTVSGSLHRYQDQANIHHRR